MLRLLRCRSETIWLFCVIAATNILLEAFRISELRHTGRLSQSKIVMKQHTSVPIQDRPSTRGYNSPFVKRKFGVTNKQRKPLSSLETNEQLEGRIISIVKYGMYVDVGVTRDGLLHIRDVSDKYFINDLGSRYSTGEDITVWVKSVDPENNKLNLQLYPPLNDSEKIPLPTLTWSDLTIGQPLKGQILRFSDYGAYVDVGCPCLAFLQRLKIRSNRKQRKLKAYELLSVKNDHDFYLFNFDENLNRIALTTYPPSDWDKVFGIKEVRESGIDRGEDDAENNELNLRRNLALDDLTEDEDDDDEEEDDDDDEEDDEEVLSRSEEILSSKEIERLTGKKLLIDDFQQDSSDSNDVNKKHRKTEEDENDDDIIDLDNEEEEISTEELFGLLARGKQFVTTTDVREWEYVRILEEAGHIDHAKLRDIFVKAGAIRGRIDEDGFEHFVDVFMAEMGLDGDEEEEEEGDEDDDSDDDDDDDDINEDSEEEEEADMDFTYNLNDDRKQQTAERERLVEPFKESTSKKRKSFFQRKGS